MERETARSWGFKPSEFRKASVADKAEMMAHELIRSTRESAYYEKSKEKSAGKEGATGKQVDPMFEAMRKRAGIGR